MTVVSNIITFIVDTRVYTPQGVTVCNVFVQVKTNKRSSTQPLRERLADYTLQVNEDKTKTVSSIDERLTSPDNQEFSKTHQLRVDSLQHNLCDTDAGVAQCLGC